MNIHRHNRPVTLRAGDRSTGKQQTPWKSPNERGWPPVRISLDDQATYVLTEILVVSSSPGTLPSMMLRPSSSHC